MYKRNYPNYFYESNDSDNQSIFTENNELLKNYESQELIDSFPFTPSPIPRYDSSIKEDSSNMHQSNGDERFNNQNINPFNNQKNQEKSQVVKELKKILGEEEKTDDYIIESRRNWNQRNTIKRNLIQKIILNWLNLSIKDKYIKLRKIEPDLLKKDFCSFSKIIDLTLKQIYFNNICIKEIKGNVKIDNNKEIINKIIKDSELDIKMNLKLREVLEVFFNIETKVISENLKQGLIDYKQYFDSIKNNEKKKHNYKFLEKFINNLNDIYLMVKDNSGEKTTGPTTKDL
jgi:hypothetical protein